MLASITPLGERGRHQRWSVTVTAFIIGATGAGAALGALIGLAGRAAQLALPRDICLTSSKYSATCPPGGERLALLAAALAVALLLDLRPGPAPGPRRQVDERWLTSFRGWVYGLGFGAQLGLGVTTVVSSACTYAALLAAFLLADPARGALVLGCFGALRGLTPLLAAGVRSPGRLFAFHARLQRAARPARAATGAATAAMLFAALAGAIT